MAIRAIEEFVVIKCEYSGVDLKVPAKDKAKIEAKDPTVRGEHNGFYVSPYWGVYADAKSAYMFTED